MTASGRPPIERILDIADLGGRGDGIARPDGDPVYVPFALPGEKVRAELSGNRARLSEILVPSPDRVAPVCRHFTTCGGCAVQHLADSAYRRWKRGLVATALAHRGIECSVDTLVDGHGTGRRRVTLHVTFANGAPCAGFMRARSHDLLDLDCCPILTPALTDAPAIARALAGPFAQRGKPFDIHLTATQTGIDANIRLAGPLDLDSRLDLPAIAEQHDLARITVGGELAVERRKPRIAIGAAMVEPAPGAFLQATAAGEVVLGALIAAHVGTASTVADLFCGIGPFALRLAQTATIFAVDSDAGAIAALEAAVRHASGLKPLTTLRRDLARDPLTSAELGAYEAVIFDPPRAGAEAQARELAAAGVPTVIAVSCDPASFARDASILIGGGYRLTRLTPVDQFRHSPHVELVARFARAG